ncbi:MAG: ABC transporter ATP-binding protein [Desulfitobacterium hafniense]|nr:ABC transporter ATP-binding protein [Desulfitobacterium hafniense]
MNEYPFELSGGMKQRVLLAMALSCGSKLLLSDEPTTALDVTIQAQILKLMKETADQLGTSVLLITHDLAVVAQTCHRVAVMYSGNIVESGPVREVLHKPRHPYTKALLQALPDPDGSKKELKSIPGSVPNLLKPPSGCRFHPRCSLVDKQCRKIRPQLTRVSENHYVACWRDGHHA